MLGNVKNSLLGRFHAIRKKHVPRNLAEFEYRFNRRFDFPAMIERLVYVRTLYSSHADSPLENG
jgi:hypothetical protein